VNTGSSFLSYGYVIVRCQEVLMLGCAIFSESVTLPCFK